MRKRKIRGKIEGNTKRKPIVTWNNDESPPSMLRRSASFNKMGRPSVPASGSAFSQSAPPESKKRSFYLLTLVLLIATVIVLTYGVDIRKLQDYFPAHEQASLLPPRTVIVSLPEISPTSTMGVSYVIKKGDTLNKVTEQLGFSSFTALAIEDALRKLNSDTKSKIALRVGQKLQVAIDGEVGIKEMVLPIDSLSNIVVRVQPDASFIAEKETIVQPKREHFAVGVITTSFAAAAKEAGVSYSYVDELVDLFSDRVVFHQDFRVGDRFTMIYRDEGIGNGVGPILAAALKVNGEELIAARYVGSDGRARYFNEKGQLLGNSFLRYPLQFSRISSYFSFARFHPILRRFRPHKGVDFAAPTGTPVRSVASGKVIFAGRNGPSGIMVKIQHNERYSTAYLHLSKIAGNVKKGATVAQGDIIGAVGQTGSATGPHLHYSFYDNGKYVDPLKIKLPYLEDLHAGTKIARSYLERVLFTLQHYQGLDLNKLYTGQVG